MSANKPKQQEINRKPGQDEEEFDQGRNPVERGEQRPEHTQDKTKNKGGDFESR